MSAFELVGLLAAVVAVLGYINHRFIRLPDTVGITAAGSLFALALDLVGRGIPAIGDWASHIEGRVDFSAILLHGMLGLLLFAGALQINISDLARQKLPVLVLATVGVVLSTVAVGYGTHWVLALAGVQMPLLYCLLFGALISPTDPIAVLGVLKTVGVPKALEIDIAGESLFNDGTGVVAFIVLLGIATGQFEPTPAAIATMLVKEVLGAVGYGLIAGYAGFFLLRGLDSYPVEILVTLAMATGGYALAERLHVSAPIAMVIMGLVIGNHGAKSAMSATTRAHLFSFWELIDEILNLMLFGLIGLKLLAVTDGDASWWQAVLLIPVVLAARFLSVGVPALLMRRFIRRRTPHAVKVLTWGGLRGGISIALALSLPEIGGRDLIVMATYAVVLFSLLVQATTLGALLRRLGLCR